MTQRWVYKVTITYKITWTSKYFIDAKQADDYVEKMRTKPGVRAWRVELVLKDE